MMEIGLAEGRLLVRRYPGQPRQYEHPLATHHKSMRTFTSTPGDPGRGSIRIKAVLRFGAGIGHDAKVDRETRATSIPSES
jgi:hypothetical protein